MTRTEGPGRATAVLAVGWLLLVGAVPLARLLAESLAGTALPAALSDPATWRAASWSLVLALGAAALATAIGAALAWALLLRGLPARGVLIFGAVLPALVPAQVMALGWIQAGGPASPLLLALDLAPPIGTPNPIYSAAGMVALLAVQSAPLVFLALAALLRRVPGEVVLAARGLGATPDQALRRAVWPLLAPGLLAGAGLAYVAALGNFGVGALIGIPARIPVLPVLIWQRLSAGGTASLAQAAALALILAAMAAPALVLQSLAAKRAPAAGRLAFEALPLRRATRAAALGGVLLYLAIVLLVPMLALVAAALVPAIGMELSGETATLRHFLAALAPGAQTARSFGNSLMLSTGAALVLALAALPIAMAMRARAVRLATTATDLPYALPGACTSVAAILVVLSLPGGGALYGTLGLIGLAYLTRFQALALRPVAAAAARLDPTLDEAARGMGAGALRRLFSVHLPPLAPALAAGAILVSLTAVNEVTVSSLLYGPGTQTLGVLVFNLQESGQSPLAAAVSCLALLLSAALMAMATLAARRLPAGTLPWRP
ncbi:iron ABC transporter permease [Roseomonas stagni]|uniref:Iron ABC transporter permease n=1 Tax=Falsiroseomonas algicola TaxID=2716930 RepID=A0A6M1LHK7_9PROT|nr:ABC transporter permease subunit [Falsiroseomonas algicola]NGM19394.1 iron ABC transporter permease [Falsiroseomonas algicola]